MKTAHVVALLGMSPAVITELIWWLVFQEEYKVIAIDLWKTSGASTQKFQTIWNNLQTELEAHAHPVPSVEIHTLTEVGGAIMEDIATDHQAKELSNQLGNAIRQLRNQRKASTLIGGLSGGRKSMSAALMTAFMAHGNPGDKLIHLWLNPSLEEALREERFPFIFPNPETAARLKIPVDNQVIGYEVPFFPLRSLIGDESILARLQNHSLSEVSAATIPPTRATFIQQKNSKWTLQPFADTKRLPTVELPRVAGELYAVLCQANRALSVKEVVNKLDDTTNEDTVKKRLSSLRKRLKKAALHRSLMVHRTKNQIMGAKMIETTYIESS